MNKLNRKTILLVEDEVLVAMATKMELEKLGFTIVIAYSGEDAIRIAKADKIDLILMDIDLGGGIDGTETAEIILQDNDIPILFLSSHADPEIVEKTEKITSYGYVVKNTGLTVLDASIKMAFKLFEANKATRMKESLLLSIADNYPNSYISIIEEDYTIGFTSGQEFKKVNLDPQQFVGKSLEQIFNDQVDIVREYYEKTFRGEECSFELFINGQYQFYRTVPLYSENGSINQILAVVENITERKKAESALKESETRFKTIIEHSNELFYFQDTEHRLHYVSPQSEAIFGYTPEEMKVKWTDLVTDNPINKEGLDITNKAIKTGEKQGKYILEIKRKDGKLRFVEIEESPVKDINGNVIAVSGALRDITQHKQVEDLARIQHDLSMSLNMASVLDDVLKMCVDAAIQASGMDCGGIYLVDDTSGALDLLFHKGLPPTFVQAVAHYDANTLNTQIVMKGKPVYTSHCQLGVPLEKAQESENLLAMAVVPVCHQDRVIACLNIASHTIDEVSLNARIALETIASQIGSAIVKKKAEEALEKALQQNKNLLRELQHRAKNSFSMICSMINLSLESAVSDEAKSVLNEVASKVMAISELYDLLYSTDAVTDVRIDKYLARIGSSLLNISETITLKKTYDAITVPVKTAIPVGIIIVELITNSIKHAYPGNQKGTITLVLKKTNIGALIEVEDDGIGFPEGLEAAAVDSLGMKLVHALVRQIGGTFIIKGGNGTQCVVDFPLEEKYLGIV